MIVNVDINFMNFTILQAIIDIKNFLDVLCRRDHLITVAEGHRFNLEHNNAAVEMYIFVIDNYITCINI